MMFRKWRIFARLRAGFTYEEIADEEGVTITRIRQIVSNELEQRSVDSGVEHAKLQLERLASVMQLAAEAIAAGDVTAITVASANQAYDEEARKKLMDKINRMAESLVSTRSCTRQRKSTSRSLGDRRRARRGRQRRADMASQTEEPAEANAREPFSPETSTAPDYFSLNPS
jgi:transcriptional regulator with XRE-family HTH domain